MNRENFGSYLKNARAARQLALLDMARITKIPERSLAALESGSREDLPADVYVRGFVSSYARVVGLDVADALARYGTALHGEPAPDASMPTLAARLAPGITA